MSIFKSFKKKHPVELSPINRGQKLPTKVEDFDWCHYKVLRQLKNHPVNVPFSGYMSLEVDIPRFIPILIDLGLVKLGTYEDGLNALKNDTLKEILKNAGLKVSGNKATLIAKIKENFSENEIRSLDVYSDIYVHTKLAKPIIDASYEKFDEERGKFFNKAIELILSGNMNSAYRIICKKNAEMPVPPGSGCDWESRYYKGIEKSRAELYGEMLKNSDNKMIAAMAIYQDMSGPLREAPQYKKSSISEKKAIRQSGAYASSERHMQEYIKCNVKKYRYLACLDNETCPICGELDGKVFYVDQAIPGVNYPPMHEGCRCTTISELEGLTQNGTKFARDPITNKGIKVPASMTYEDYKREYLDKIK